VLWHQDIKKDLLRISRKTAESIVSPANHRLAIAPQFIGEPLKGTTNLLWKLRFSKHRLIYTMNVKAREVWVLSVQKREIVYKDRHVQSLLRLAIALQERIENDE
jgi:mRNA-degrading endonuclease RelE of RelBE toxin-antitoxin system